MNDDEKQAIWAVPESLSGARVGGATGDGDWDVERDATVLAGTLEAEGSSGDRVRSFDSFLKSCSRIRLTSSALVPLTARPRARHMPWRSFAVLWCRGSSPTALFFGAISHATNERATAREARATREKQEDNKDDGKLTRKTTKEQYSKPNPRLKGALIRRRAQFALLLLLARPRQTKGVPTVY